MAKIEAGLSSATQRAKEEVIKKTINWMDEQGYWGLKEEFLKAFTSPTPPLKEMEQPKYIEIKKKDIRGNYKVKIDLRKLKGSLPLKEKGRRC